MCFKLSLRGVFYVLILISVFIYTIPFFMFHPLDEYQEEPRDINPGLTAPTEDQDDSSCTQTQRFQLLRRKCRQRGSAMKDSFDADSADTYWRLLVDDEHKVLYCALPKAASTTFYNLFYYAMTGEHLAEEDIHCAPCWQKVGLVWLSTFRKAERDRRLHTYHKILVARHPLDRLLSCWNGKFTRPYKHRTWLDHGPLMIKMFRSMPANKSINLEYKNGARFEEFLKYVNYLEMNQAYSHDQHWNTLSRLCHPCSIDYDYIVKVETLGTDSKHVLRRLNLTHDDFPFINARRQTNAAPVPKTLKLPSYKNSTISDKLLNGILKMYDLDMDLFGYSWNSSEYEASCSSGASECC